MIVIADASPLITFARIGRFELLRLRYERLIIPGEVFDEVVAHGAGMAGSAEVDAASWIEVRQVNQPSPEGLRACAGLGKGETAAILLAHQLKADMLLVDEWRARRAAGSLGLSIAGCVAVLEESFARGLVSDLRSTYIQMLRKGIRVDLRIFRNSLERLGLEPL